MLLQGSLSIERMCQLVPVSRRSFYRFFEDVDRGQAVYFVLFKDGKPSEIFFAGMSYD